MELDKNQLESFLRWLDPTEGAQYVFQAFTDDRSRKRHSSVSGRGGSPRRRDANAKAFAATKEEAAKAALRLQRGGAGVFVQINSGPKRGKRHIQAIRCIWVDTDGAPIQPILESGVVRPNAVVATSPGRYHIYWKVRDCPLEKFGEAQTLLADVFRTDGSVTNLDRVMRVPGTWHLKDTTKPFMVTWRQGADNEYTLEEILQSLPKRQAPSAHIPSAAYSGAQALITTGETYELPDVLQPGRRTNELISYIGKLVAQGYGEEYIEREVRRVNVELCQPGTQPIPDDVLSLEVLSAIPRFIADRDAQQEVPAGSTPGTGDDIFSAEPKQQQTLEVFLERYVYVEAGQMVVDLKADPRHAVYKLDEFNKTHANKWAGKKRLADLWLKSSERRTVRDITYMPGADRIFQLDGHEFYNTFIGNGMAMPEQVDASKARVFFDHIKYLIPKREDAELFLKWLAFSVQQPSKRVPWAPLIVGRPGIGKGWLYQAMQRLFGEHNCSMIGPEDFAEDRQFNEWASGKLLVCIDEMYTKKKWELMDRLGRLMTEPMLMINHKHGKKGQERVFANFLCFSNHDDAIALRENDRRFWVYRTEVLARDADYYTDLFKWLDTDGPEHLWATLKAMDLSGFDFAAPPPMTAAKRRMIESSRSPVEGCVVDAINDRDGPLVADVTSADIVEHYVMERMGISNLTGSDRHQIRHALSEHSSDLAQTRYRIRIGSRWQRVRLRCIRNEQRWANASKQDVEKEYRRAWAISMGQKDPADKLEVVK